MTSNTLEIDPDNGMIQRITLQASTSNSIRFSNMDEGQSVLLMIDDATTTSLEWWGDVTTTPNTALTWVGGSAPTLATTGYTLVEVWKAKNTAGNDMVFACHVGDVA